MHCHAGMLTAKSNVKKTHNSSFRLEEPEPDPELKTGSDLVSSLCFDRNAIVQLDPGDPTELEGEPETVTQPEVLQQLLHVGVETGLGRELAQVSGGDKGVGAEERENQFERLGAPESSSGSKTN